MDKNFYVAPSSEEIIAFADKHLGNYIIHGEELVPESCPYCNGGDSGDQKTFYVSLRTGQYCCHRGKCGVRGGWISLLKHFGEAPKINSVSKQFKPLTLIPEPRTDTINEYFNERGISETTLDAFQIGADQTGNIIFPFYVEGELLYIKYRQPTRAVTKRKEWAIANTKPVLFGMDLCVPDQPLVITEGQIDTMSLYEAGIRNVVSVPTGCENFDWIDPCWEWLEQFDKIVLFGDDDTPGRKMIKVLVGRLGEDRCWVVEDYPDNCKDANDILVNLGAEALSNTFHAAHEMPIQHIIDLADVRFKDPTQVPRIKTMIPALDESINGIEAGSLLLVSGDTGHGKSTLSGTFLLNAIEQGYSVCAYSGELTPEKFFEWTTLQAAGSDYITLKYDAVKGKQVPVVHPPALERIREWIRGKFYLFDCADDYSIPVAENIIKTFTAMARRRGCKLFLVDNLMTAIADAPDEEYRAQAKFMVELKRFANRFNVGVILVAHPRKRKDNATITTDDISGNKVLTNLATSAVTVNKPDLQIIKSRDAGLNRVIQCAYCPDSRRIYQLSVGDLNSFSWDKTGLSKPSPLACSLPEYAVYTNQTQMF